MNSGSQTNGSSTRVHIGLLTAFVIAVGISFGVLVHKKLISVEQFAVVQFIGFTRLRTGQRIAITRISRHSKDSKVAVYIRK